MALIIDTESPSELLSAIKKAIDAKKIETWSYDSDGDFTHTPDQWKNKAWFRVRQGTNAKELQLGILGQTGINTTSVVYAVYHGRFAEMLLTHFDTKFSLIRTTALPKTIDNITTGIK